MLDIFASNSNDSIHLFEERSEQVSSHIELVAKAKVVNCALQRSNLVIVRVSRVEQKRGVS